MEYLIAAVAFIAGIVAARCLPADGGDDLDDLGVVTWTRYLT